MCHVVYIMHFMPSLADVAIGSNLATLNTLVFVYCYVPFTCKQMAPTIRPEFLMFLLSVDGDERSEEWVLAAAAHFVVARACDVYLRTCV